MKKATATPETLIHHRADLIAGGIFAAQLDWCKFCGSPNGNCVCGQQEKERKRWPRREKKLNEEILALLPQTNFTTARVGQLIEFYLREREAREVLFDFTPYSPRVARFFDKEYSCQEIVSLLRGKPHPRGVSVDDWLKD